MNAQARYRALQGHDTRYSGPAGDPRLSQTEPMWSELHSLEPMLTPTMLVTPITIPATAPIADSPPIIAST